MWRSLFRDGCTSGPELASKSNVDSAAILETENGSPSNCGFSESRSQIRSTPSAPMLASSRLPIRHSASTPPACAPCPPEKLGRACRTRTCVCLGPGAYTGYAAGMSMLHNLVWNVHQAIQVSWPAADICPRFFPGTAATQSRLSCTAAIRLKPTGRLASITSSRGRITALALRPASASCGHRYAHVVA